MKATKTGKCEFGGCKNAAEFRAHKLWGKGGYIDVCVAHKPGGRPRPGSLKHLPSFYRVEPLTTTVSR